MYVRTLGEGAGRQLAAPYNKKTWRQDWGRCMTNNDITDAKAHGKHALRLGKRPVVLFPVHHTVIFPDDYGMMHVRFAFVLPAQRLFPNLLLLV